MGLDTISTTARFLVYQMAYGPTISFVFFTCIDANEHTLADGTPRWIASAVEIQNDVKYGRGINRKEEKGKHKRERVEMCGGTQQKAEEWEITYCFSIKTFDTSYHRSGLWPSTAKAT